MPIGVWIGVGVALWFVVAVVLAVWVGRVVRARDRQVPRLEPPSARPRRVVRAPSAEAPMEQHPDDRS
jgi:hypothetical protein